MSKLAYTFEIVGVKQGSDPVKVQIVIATRYAEVVAKLAAIEAARQVDRLQGCTLMEANLIETTEVHKVVPREYVPIERPDTRPPIDLRHGARAALIQQIITGVNVDLSEAYEIKPEDKS